MRRIMPEATKEEINDIPKVEETKKDVSVSEVVFLEEPEKETTTVQVNGDVQQMPEQQEFTGTMPEVSTVQEQLSTQNYYIVEKGDTLDKISLKTYGTTSQVDAICRMNGLSDGNLIFIGQKLLLP